MTRFASTSVFDLLQNAVQFKHMKKVQLHIDMSFKKGGPLDFPKGSQKPLGVIRPHFENCSTEARDKDRVESQLPYAEESYSLLKC